MVFVQLTAAKLSLKYRWFAQYITSRCLTHARDGLEQ